MMLALMRRQWFVVAIVAVLLIAWLAARSGLPSIPAATAHTVKLSFIVGIFILSGLALRTGELVSGFAQWRLHSLIQGCSLILAPLVAIALDQLWLTLGCDAAWRLGLLVVAALPTTITSCVVMTTAAGGNQVAALINASGGNVLGVFITPLWLLLVAGATQATIDIVPVLQQLLWVVVVPLIVGQVLRCGIREWLTPPRRKGLSVLGQLLLLGVLAVSFFVAFYPGDSAAPGLAAATADQQAVTISLPLLLMTLAVCATLHAWWLFLPWWLSAVLRMNAADRSCAILCASQKTLALGLPLIVVCFAGHPNMAIITLPLLVYHPIQLLVGGWLTARLARPLSN